MTSVGRLAAANVAAASLVGEIRSRACEIARTNNASFEDQRRYIVVRPTPARLAIRSIVIELNPPSMKSANPARKIAASAAGLHGRPGRL